MPIVDYLVANRNRWRFWFSPIGRDHPYQTSYAVTLPASGESNFAIVDLKGNWTDRNSVENLCIKFPCLLWFRSDLLAIMKALQAKNLFLHPIQELYSLETGSSRDHDGYYRILGRGGWCHECLRSPNGKRRVENAITWTFRCVIEPLWWIIPHEVKKVRASMPMDLATWQTEPKANLVNETKKWFSRWCPNAPSQDKIKIVTGLPNTPLRQDLCARIHGK